MPNFSKTVTINRSEWRRAGFGEHATQLYNTRETTGYSKCCLGQYLEQCGIPLDELASRETPDMVDTSAWNPEVELLVELSGGTPDTTWIADRAMSINDDLNLTNEEREAALTQLFAEHGVTLMFVN